MLVKCTNLNGYVDSGRKMGETSQHSVHFLSITCEVKGDLKVKKKVKESFDILFPSVFFIFLSILCLNVIQICFIALSEADQSQEG